VTTNPASLSSDDRAAEQIWPPAARAFPWPEALILVVAALTRFWRLDYHSFWFDEVVSLNWAGSGALYIWNTTFPLVQDKHPPAYYLLLHYWRTLLDLFAVGRNDVALRALGALLGTLTVLGILLLARRLSGRATGLLAGLLVALSPVLVWYSQELRMFQPATTALVWAGYSLLRGWQALRLRTAVLWWLGFVAALEFALYSYLFSAFMLPAAGLTLVALVILDARQRRRAGTSVTPALARFLTGGAALAAATVLFLPLARNAWLVNDSEGQAGQAFMSFLPNLQNQLRIATIWRAAWPAPLPEAALFLIGALVLIGLTLPWPRKWAQDFPAGRRNVSPAARYLDQIWLVLWLGAPLLVGNLLLATSDTVFAEDRYFLFLAPFTLWAVARGVVAVGARWRAAGWVLAGAMALLLVLALPRLWSPAMFREDWRAAARYIVDYQRSSPGVPAAIVTHVDYTNRPTNWYVRQEMSEDDLPIFYPFGGTLTDADGDARVAPPLLGIQESGAATLWLLQSHLEGVDDSRVVERWLNEHFPLVTEQYPTGIKLTGYAMQHRFAALPALGSQAVYPEVELAPGLILAACEMTTPVVGATDERLHPPSGWAHVRLWWQPTAPLATDYIPTVQVVGPEGVWGERLYRDGEVMRREPTSTWAPGGFVREEIDVNLNPVTPAGEYPVVVGLRDAAGNETGVKTECGRVRVVQQ
jgi:hypothetical protein